MQFKHDIEFFKNGDVRNLRNVIEKTHSAILISFLTLERRQNFPYHNEYI